MAELYTTASVSEAFEAGKRTAQYFAEHGPTDIHTIDAGLQALQQVNVLTREHADEQPVFSKAPESIPEEEAREELLAMAPPVGAVGDAPEIDPGTLALLIRLSLLVKTLLGW